MPGILDLIMDAVDIETFVVCRSEEDGRKLVVQLIKDWGFTDVDIVFCQFQGPGARVRGRAYVHRSGDVYGWLKPRDKEA